MNILTHVINYLLPFLSVILLILGITKKGINYILIALWLSLIAFLLNYQMAGGEVLGSYFGYGNAAIYTLNILIILISLLYLVFQFPKLHTQYMRLFTGFVASLLIVGSTLLLINLWINANFIENRLEGTAIVQVVSKNPPEYCPHRYIFYKVNTNKKISYLCPNYYGLIPSVGHLEVAPEFLAKQLAQYMRVLPRRA